MRNTDMISISIPDNPSSGKYFSFRIKRNVSHESCEYNQPSKIFVFSGINGNFTALCRLLVKGRVIDRKFRWIFNDGHIVIVGNCFSKTDNAIECLWLLYSLEDKARRYGGYVHFILGSHEIYNLNGDWKSIHPNYSVAVKAQHTAIYNGNITLWEWLSTKNIIEKIGSFLFVHGGISKALIGLQNSIAELNHGVKKLYSSFGETLSDSLLGLSSKIDNSSFDHSEYHQDQLNVQDIDKILDTHAAKSLITTHTSVKNTQSLLDGRVINLSANTDNRPPDALLIENDTLYRVSIDGTKSKTMRSIPIQFT